jgi:hypothetical protein
MNRFEHEPRFERELELRRMIKQDIKEFVRIYTEAAGPIPAGGIRGRDAIQLILDKEFPPPGDDGRISN